MANTDTNINNNSISTPTGEVSAITVKLSKLTEGVGMVFAGVLTMLEALDTSSAQKLVERFSGAATAIEGETDGRESAGHDTEVPEDRTADDPVSDEMSVPGAESNREKEKAEASASGVTQDDITKIIVQKIKQKRSNNEKIGQLLKTYGAAKVSELPASKYEAFITDLSAI